MGEAEGWRELVEERGKLEFDKDQMKSWQEKLGAQGEEIDKTFCGLLVREKQVIDSYSELRTEKSDYFERKDKIENLEKLLADQDSNLQELKSDLVRQEAETEFLKEKMKIFGSTHSESLKKDPMVDSNPPTSESDPEDLSESDLTDTALLESLGEHQELHEFVRMAKIEVTASKEKYGAFVSTVEAFGEQNLTKIDRNLAICDGFVATVEKLIGALDSGENFIQRVDGEGLLELRKVNKKLRSRLEIIFGLKGCLDDGLSAWELARANGSGRDECQSEKSEKSSGKGDVDLGNSARDTEPKFG